MAARMATEQREWDNIPTHKVKTNDMVKQLIEAKARIEEPEEELKQANELLVKTRRERRNQRARFRNWKLLYQT